MKFAIERSYVRSPSGGKKHPGISPLLRWEATHSQQTPLLEQEYVHVHPLRFFSLFVQSTMTFTQRPNCGRDDIYVCGGRTETPEPWKGFTLKTA